MWSSSSSKHAMNARIFGRSVSNSTPFSDVLKSKPMPNKSLKFLVAALLLGIHSFNSFFF